MGLAPDPGPPPRAVADLWHLGAEPSALLRAADAWRAVARDGAAAGAAVEAAATGLLETWAGPSALGYRANQAQLSAGYRSVAEVATVTAASLDAAASALTTAQAHLDDCWLRLCRATPVRVRAVGGRVLLDDAGSPEIAAVAHTTVSAAVREALAIRADADARLMLLATELEERRRELWPRANLAGHAAQIDAWAPGDWPISSHNAGAGQVIVDGNVIMINASSLADTIRVGRDETTGERLVTIGEVVHRFPATAEIVVRGGGGADIIDVDQSAGDRLTILAGPGDDRVVAEGGAAVFGQWGRDTLLGGDGTDEFWGGVDGDYLDGRGGDDALDGGADDDTIYGLGGADRLWGGAGRDYLDGGAGDDLIDGGWSDDVLSGGTGADRLIGGEGTDRLYGGEGSDQILGGGTQLASGDRAFAQPDDAVSGAVTTVLWHDATIGAGIRIEGSTQFVERVSADLETLRSSERGAQMLAAIDAAQAQRPSWLSDLPLVGDAIDRPHTLVIREMDQPNGFEHTLGSVLGGTASSIDYNPSFDDLALDAPVPPIVVLYHELAHAYDAFYGTGAEGTYERADNPGAPNDERAAVGLPIDDDGERTTPMRLDPDHPYALTENGLREEFGLDLRTRY